MCLQPNFRKPTEKQSTGIGWKVFRNDFKGEFQTTQKVRAVNAWINEKHFRSDYSRDVPNEGYGFHVFLRKKDAIAWFNSAQKAYINNVVIARVQYRKATAIGTFVMSSDFIPENTEGKCIVAKEIFIESPKEGI